MRAMKKALLVGINTYTFNDVGAHDRKDDLGGCLNDVEAMSQLLAGPLFKFEVAKLTESDADRTTILKMLENLVTEAGPGSQLVFYFAGHGSQASVDGRLCEIICPSNLVYDGHWKNGISDEDLWGVFGKVPKGVSIEVLLDSCCSNGMAFAGRQSDDGSGGPEGRSLRYLAPRQGTDRDAADSCADRVRFSGEKPKQGCQYVFWSAAEGTAHERPFEDVPHGVFTYHFHKLLTGTNGNVSRKIFFSRLWTALGGDEGQKPQWASNTNTSVIERILAPMDAAVTGFIHKVRHMVRRFFPYMENA